MSEIKRDLNRKFKSFLEGEGYYEWLRDDFRGDDMSKLFLFENRDLILLKFFGEQWKFTQFRKIKIPKSIKSINHEEFVRNRLDSLFKQHFVNK
jgi:hypothetical protein